MAQFNADIALQVQTTDAEHKVKKTGQSISKAQTATRNILAIDKLINLK